MRRSRSCLAVALTVLAVALTTAAPRAETLPDQAIQREQLTLRRRPRDAGAYLRLGDAYVQKARATGDMSYLDLAAESLRQSLAIAPTNAGAVRHLAHVFASRHDFPAAVSQALQALALDPRDGDAWGVLGDAYLELGLYDRAREAYDAMIRLKGNLASHARMSGLESVRGNPRGSIDQLRRAIASGRSASQPRESIAWAEWQLGAEHFAIGEVAAAEAQFEAALHTFPGYYRALAGLAQVRVAQGRHGDAVLLYNKALAIAPFPEYASALGDLYTRMGRPGEASKQYELVEYIGRLNALNRVLYNRELAYFYADHDRKVEVAVELAQSEIESRRDIYGYDVLAWALYKSGRPEEALGPMNEALRLGTRDAKLFFHAGMIHQALGHRERAREYLAQALATNPHFHVLLADEAARVLANLAPGLARAAETPEP